MGCSKCAPARIANTSVAAAFKDREGQVERHLNRGDIYRMVVAALLVSEACGCRKAAA